ncbi:MULTISPECIES: A24 family peptidase [unclassified Sphingomonas]|uniref:A24 family peptidase n=1 Tax=unclassified Sphingomonas TaxID=196159 RepID=UPI00070237A0|nr:MULTISPECIES: prepilin peptidase [unclassified Sphingomonas]KQM60019.1 peptidase [Sphingomonas sp. Leaf16]KQN11417.1 peptidase [Sphingomonas sp. Leaf29]KQN18738.1 peptidase [Sphingomonas sp. Leaf32]
MGGIVVPWLALALLLLLAIAGIEDARTREIANWKNAAIALLALPWWWANGLSGVDMAWQLGVAGIVFALFFAAFVAGQMGGGDVKMIAALALWLPPGAVLSMLMVMSVLGGVLTLLFLADRWRRRASQVAEIPYGIAIAIAGMLAIANPFLTHFGDA